MSAGLGTGEAGYDILELGQRYQNVSVGSCSGSRSRVHSKKKDVVLKRNQKERRKTQRKERKREINIDSRSRSGFWDSRRMKGKYKSERKEILSRVLVI